MDERDARSALAECNKGDRSMENFGVIVVAIGHLENYSCSSSSSSSSSGILRVTLLTTRATLVE